MPGHDPRHYTIRNAAYDLRKLRGKHLADKPAQHPPVPHLTRSGRPDHQRPAHLRDQIIAPLLAGVADPRIRRTPRHWTDIDRHYQALRLEMMALFAGPRHRLRMKHPQRQHFVDRVPSSG